MASDSRMQELNLTPEILHAGAPTGHRSVLRYPVKRTPLERFAYISVVSMRLNRSGMLSIGQCPASSVRTRRIGHLDA